MALIIKDRVKEITTTTGTGAVSLGGASATFDAFQSVMSNGDTTFYAIVHTASGTDEWEVGLGTWNTGNTLTRTTVYAGSNGTSAVNFSSGNKDIFMTYPASKAAVAGEDVTFADITATDITSTGTVTLSADPSSALQAATKQYVDTIAAAGIHYHTPVRVEHPSNLNATYNNGSSGVGATLTNAGTNAALVLDNVSMVLNDRVLVANQTDQTQNGVYTVTTVGDGSTAWVLTRSTDTDSYAPSDGDSLGEGDAFFIKEGDTNAGHLDVMTTSGTITFGTTNIVFSEVAETSIYSAGTGLTLTGTTFSTNQDISTSASPTFAGATVNGNITVTGTVDGRDVATDGSKLDGIEAGATADQTASEIKTAYESNSNTNAFTDAEQTKLSGIETGATADQTASEILTAIKTVDGSASGLDADLLDGQQGSYYLNTSTTFSGDVSGTYNNIVVANDSHTHDGRYYTETEADSRFWNASGDETITGKHKITHANTGTEPYIALTIENTGTSAGIALDANSGSGRKYEIQSSTGGDFFVYDRDATAYRFYISNSGALYNGQGTNRIFADNYHPNADKWTTARTLSLSGDASGSVSWDGSANATLSVSVGDADTLDGFHLDSSSNTGYRSSVIPYIKSDGVMEIARYLDFHTTGSTVDYDVRMNCSGANALNFEGLSSTGLTVGGSTIWTAANDGSGSGLDADLLDGTQGANVIRSGGTITVNDLDGSGYPRITASGGSAQLGLFRSGSGNIGGMYIGADSARWRVYNTSFSERFGVDSGGNSHSVSSSRAPIFYDSNNTARYIDPAGDSYAGDYYNMDGWFRNYGQRGLYNQDTNSHFFSAGTQYWHISGGNTTSGGLIFYQYYNATQGNATNRKGFVYWDSSGFGLLNSGGSWWLNNTANNNNYLCIGGYSGYNAFNSNVGQRLMFGGADTDAQSNYYIGTNLENYGGNYSKLDLRWHTGIRMGAQAQYGGVRIFDSEDLGTRLFSVGETDTHVRVTNTLYAANFYDINNTTYYVDPASTSRMNRVHAGYDPGTDNSVGCSNWFRSSGSTGWYNASYGGGIYMIDSTWVRVYNGKSFYLASGTIRSDGDIRAPIFYDQNDTAYYTNPAGESSISSALVGSHIKFGDSTYSGGRIDWNYNSNNMRLSRVTGISFDWGTGAGNSDAHSYHGIASINDSGSSAGDMRISSRGDIHFRIDTDANSTNNYIKFFNNYVSGTTTQMGYWGGGTTTGQLNVYGTISCAIYYDRNDTAYYVDPNSASHMHTLHLQGPVYSRGDSNTRHEFHAADQWRVVVGGSERLEVKNSSPHVLVTGDLNSTSDKRLKENVAPITNALADVTQLEGVSFDWKDTGTRGHGFIAQQVEPILPDVVSTDEETGMKSINYVGMIGHLVEAIKELKAEIEELKGQ